MSARSEIFWKDPLMLSDSDLDIIVAYFKEHRGHFDLVKKDGAIKRQRKARVKKPKVDVRQLDIEQLIAQARGKS